MSYKMGMPTALDAQLFYGISLMTRRVEMKMMNNLQDVVSGRLASMAVQFVQKA